MIEAIVIAVLLIDDLRLRGKLYGVMKQVKTIEVEIEQKFVRSAKSILASIKAKL